MSAKTNKMRNAAMMALTLIGLTVAGLGSAGCDMQEVLQKAGQFSSGSSVAPQASDLSGTLDKSAGRSVLWYPRR